MTAGWMVFFLKTFIQTFTGTPPEHESYKRYFTLSGAKTQC
jgi:hypothetical protein